MMTVVDGVREARVLCRKYFPGERGTPSLATDDEGYTDYKQNAGCRSCESSSGIAVDVQQRLNCALPSFSLSSDSLSRFEVFTACPGSDRLIHSAELAVDLFNRSSNLENRRR